MDMTWVDVAKFGQQMGADVRDFVVLHFDDGDAENGPGRAPDFLRCDGCDVPLPSCTRALVQSKVYPSPLGTERVVVGVYCRQCGQLAWALATGGEQPHPATL